MSRFADTSYFLALLIPNDENHAAAVKLAAGWRGTLVTTDFVLLEVGNHLSPQRSRNVFSRFFRALSQEPRITIIPASRQWIERGLALYESRPDKNWSLTDCISFEVMREHMLSDALTADHHFTQQGFNILIKPA
jgi:predicted nucleic acid-binding protein